MKLTSLDGKIDDSLQPHIMIITRLNRLAININIFPFCFVQRILNYYDLTLCTKYHLQNTKYEYAIKGNNW